MNIIHNIEKNLSVKNMKEEESTFLNRTECGHLSMIKLMIVTILFHYKIII